MDSEILEDISMVFLGPYNMTKSYLNLIWSERFWLRKDVTWRDLGNGQTSTIRYPQVSELHLAVLLTFLLIFLRSTLEKFVFSRIAMSYGLKYARKAEPESVLENFYNNHGKKPSHAQVDKLTKEVNWTAMRVQRWFRTKRKESQCKIKKFSECSWRAVKYSTAFLYGLYVLWDEPWALDASESIGFSTWPHHSIKTEFVIYYMVELAYYTSVLLSLFTDVYRSDFAEQAVHHIATVILLSFSWVANFVRIGLLVLTVHNAADIWLQGTKMCGYLNKMNLVPFFIGMFVTVWMCTRVYLYPIYILKPLLSETWRIWEDIWPSALVMVACLVLLQVLHLIWTYYVVICLYRAWRRGSFKDERSDDESSSNGKED